MTIKLNRAWRVALPSIVIAASAVSIGLGGAAPDAAQAAESCPGGVLTRTPVSQDAQIWDLEGKITGYDTAARTITTNGMTFTIPASQLIKTQDLDQATGNIEFTGPGSLTDPALEAQLPIIGSSTIASGTVVTTPVGTAGDLCLTFEATSVYVEPAEHGVVGPLLSVDAANNTFVVGGTTVKMNTDPRYPQNLIDLAGTQLTVDQLAGQIGALVDAVGYYDANTGTLRGTVVEADILTPQALTDTVALSRATWKSPELRVRGAVSRGPDGLYASTVDLYTGASDGTNCTGVKLATTAVDSAADGDGAFEFRTRLTTNPQTVCVKSIGGGVDDIPVSLG